jgi:outer membrane protein TolC
MRALTTAVLLGLALTACAIHPRGEKEERDRAAEAGREFENSDDAPTLPADPRPEDYLRVAFYANAELRARYWEWRAALERIPQDASPPNPALNFSYLFGGPQMKAWDRTTLGLSNDPMTNLSWPSKLAAAGRKDLEEARAAGLRFEATKFKIQARVLTRYVDLALHEVMIRTQAEDLALLSLVAEEASSGVRSSAAPMADLLRAQSERDLAKNQLESLRGQHATLSAEMNALLGRAADAALPLPASMPPLRPLPASDAEILALAADRSPELAALSREVAGRQEALDLARQQRIPDFGLSFDLMGSVSRSLGGMIVLPLRGEAIDGAIEEARANVRAAEAIREQNRRDLATSFVLDLYVLRSDERQADLFERVLVPRADLTARAAEVGLAAGRGTLMDVVRARRAALDARLALAELRAQREKALVAIETWSALDVEALHPVRMGSLGAP